MLHDALFALWFLLPAAIANAAPIIAAKTPLLKSWDAPIDGGRTWRGVELLGAHKTWRGIIAGMIISTIIFGIQQFVSKNIAGVDFITGRINYGALPLIPLGPLFGLGALSGDAIESFFKRQRHIPSGHSWVPFDQTDYVIGAILVSLPFIILRPVVYAWMIVLYCVLHMASTFIGYKIGLKDRPI